jgi:hypothetical protein
MVLSNQSELPAFFSPQEVKIKIDLIPEDDLSRMTKSRKMTYREWLNPGRYLSEIGQYYTVKKVCPFPVPRRDVTNQTLPGLE